MITIVLIIRLSMFVDQRKLVDWSSHSQAKINTHKIIMIPKSPKTVPVNNSHLKVYWAEGAVGRAVRTTHISYRVQVRMR